MCSDCRSNLAAPNNQRIYIGSKGADYGIVIMHRVSKSRLEDHVDSTSVTSVSGTVFGGPCPGRYMHCFLVMELAPLKCSVEGKYLMLFIQLAVLQLAYGRRLKNR